MVRVNKLRGINFPFVLGLVVAALSGTDLRAEDDDLVVRVAITPETSVFVGQKIQLEIDVFGARHLGESSQSFSDRYTGAIVVVPPNGSVRLSEQIRGGNFIGQRYGLWIYPQRSGTLEIPSLDLKVQLKPFGIGKEATFKSATTEPLSVEVRYPGDVPVGSQVICASEFSVQQTWKPSSGVFTEGDGITRTIQRTIAGAPGMLLAPFPTGEITGVKVYGKQPEVADNFDRGSMTGKRTDRVTYVFEQPGTVQLPSLRVSWWDLEAGKLQTTELAGMKLEISRAAETATESPVGKSQNGETDFRMTLMIFAALIVVATITTGYRKRWMSQLRDWHQRIETSEQGLFRRFVMAAKANDPKQTLRTLTQWWDVADESNPAPQLDQFLTQHGDENSLQQLRALQVAVDQQSKSWNTRELVGSVQHARNRWQAARCQRQTTVHSPLPPLRNSAL